ncbi:uncharacterized protein VTP21DRAFT_10072 [Calcarisporiella thermophila]|uniref:uncharacterized protein n=1 Tax=Calcarisporiella thermophila TaxID=911321 RepID=UPI0037421738
MYFNRILPVLPLLLLASAQAFADGTNHKASKEKAAKKQDAPASPPANDPNQGLSQHYPPVDQVPPVVKEWVDLVDWSKVPNAPISPKSPGGPKCKDGQDPFCAWTCTTCMRNETDLSSCPEKDVWGLTYDDGPTDFSPKLYDYLDSINQKATFFIIGSRALDHGDYLKRAYQAGHQIASHTWSHPYLTSLTNEQIVAEVKWTEMIIKERTGVTPKYIRPPYGDIDDRVRAIMKQLGYKIVLWELDTNDWMVGEDKSFNPEWIDGNFTEWTAKADQYPYGPICLEHDLYQGTVDAAIRNLPKLKKAYNVVPVATCMNDAHPYQENVPYPTLNGTAAASVSSAASQPASNSPASGTASALPTQNAPTTNSNIASHSTAANSPAPMHGFEGQQSAEKSQKSAAARWEKGLMWMMPLAILLLP